MKTSSAFVLALAAFLPGPGNSQDPLPALPAEELAARRQSVVNLEAHIAQREERLGAIVADIRTLDDRVEKGVDHIVTMMSGVKDSESSKVRIANVKADVMTGLKRTIDYYNQHRDAIREQLRTGKSAVPKETLEKDLAILDTRIDKRVKQIAEIAKSFPDPQELEKYETTSVVGWSGWLYANEEISEAWKQNRRDTRHTDSAREAVSNGLRDAIDHLQQRNAYLAEKLKSPNVPEAEKEYYQSEIARNNGILEQRNTELQQFSTGGATATVPVMQDQAHDLDQLVQSSRNDLREDFLAIFRKYAELNRARAEVKQLQDNLAARKEWLAKYDEQHPQ
jgi:hypothetical protein